MSRHRVRLAGLLFLAAVLLACSGGDTVAPPLAGPTVRSGDEGEGFLVANLETLSETDLRGMVLRELAQLEPGQFFRYPAISLDGDQIAAVIFIQDAATVGGADFGSDLYLTDRQASELDLLVEHAATAEFVEGVVWLDDTSIVYGYRGRDSTGALALRIERFDLATRARERLIENASLPALSADGRTLAYVALDPAFGVESIVVSDPGLASATTVVPDDSGLFGISSLAPSPDGSRIAFASLDLLIPTLTPLPGTGLRVSLGANAGAHPSGQDVWIVDRDGSGLRRLFELVAPNLSLAWSADGATLYVVGPSGFWQVDPESGAGLRLGDGLPFAQITPLPP